MFVFAYNGIELAHRYEASPVTKPDFARHYHDFYEMLYFVRGECDFVMEETGCKLKAGDVIFILPGEHHFLRFARSAPPYEHYSFKFGETVVPSFLISRLSDKQPFCTVSDEMKKLFADVDVIAAKSDTDERGALAHCRLLELLVLLCHARESEKTFVRNKTIAEIVDYINVNLKRSITLTDVCDALGLSPSYVSNKFSNYMKVSLIQYVRIKKILAAHRLIMFGERPTKAAEEYGYYDYSTFYRAYTKIMGRPPCRKLTYDQSER